MQKCKAREDTYEMLPSYVASLTACPPSCAQEHKDDKGHEDEAEYVPAFDQDCEAGKLQNDNSISTEETMATRAHRWVMAIIILAFCLFVAMSIGVRAYATATRQA
ncbi:uncharacterized protein PpBr36_06208 [Pyricularia pennisetigena]|uniref:uncharacterized protein n=1 Tax=Pyricularia pennisetigena TaxID=1578925 RepID=UPI001154B246|nr:uncharacterized protein PpBr36_06208 [Pyricularia pennisetigena]TLS23069.1 hypothetical protein PpBr36_06208 [Pyricularia pennisetigena]